MHVNTFAASPGLAANAGLVGGDMVPILGAVFATSLGFMLLRRLTASAA